MASSCEASDLNHREVCRMVYAVRFYHKFFLKTVLIISAGIWVKTVTYR